MSNKTQLSETPTAMSQGAQISSSSLVISKKREIFEQIDKVDTSKYQQEDYFLQDGVMLAPKNVLLMNPKEIRSISWREVYLPDQETYVSLKADYFVIADSRNNKKFIKRHSNPNSQIVHFKVQKLGEKLVLCCVEKYLEFVENETHLWFYFNVTKFHLQSKEVVETLHAYKKGTTSFSGIDSFLQFRGLELIDNNKKAFAVFQPIGLEKSRFGIYLIDFKHNSDSSEEKKQELGNEYQSKIVGKTFFQKKQSEKYISMINSEYGDILLLVTTDEIYEIQIGGEFKHGDFTLILKPFFVNKIFTDNKNTYLSNQTNELLLIKDVFRQTQTIADVKYGVNGLKIIILTNHGRIFVLESQQYLMSESIYELLGQKQIKENYLIENFLFQKIHPLSGMLIVEVQSQKKTQCNLIKRPHLQNSILKKINQQNPHQYVSRALLIIKMQSASISYSKFIPLPYNLSTHQYLKVYPFLQSDELVIGTIENKQQQSLILTKCQILSNKNSFIPFKIQPISMYPPIQIKKLNGNIQISLQKRNNWKKHQYSCAFSESNKSCYMLRGNQVRGFRIYDNQLSSTPKGVVQILKATFFQKPLKIIVSALTGNATILFKQFIKFYQNTYLQLKEYFTLNIRNVSDISYSTHGESLIIVLNDNSVYLVDSYRFTETKILQLNCQIQTAKLVNQRYLFIETIKQDLVLFRKPEKKQQKSKQSKQQSLLNSNLKDSIQLYEKVYELKLQSKNDIYFIDQYQIIIVRQNGILEVYKHQLEQRILKEKSDDKQVIKFNLLSKQHSHLVNKKTLKLDKDEFFTSILLSQQLGTIFLGTNNGTIKQYIFPLGSIEDPNPPKSYSYSVSNNPLCFMKLHASLSSIYIMTQLGQILQFQFTQFLNGKKKASIYTISKSQYSETELKYQFASKGYLMDDYTPLDEKTENIIKQEFQEVGFMDHKIKDDIEDVINKIKYEADKQINSAASLTKSTKNQFKQTFQQISENMKRQQKGKKQQLVKFLNQLQKKKLNLTQDYEKQLLEIYNQNDRLKAILTTLTKQYNQENIKIKQEFRNIEQEQIALRQNQMKQLQENYSLVDKKYSHFNKVQRIQSTEQQQELQQYKQNRILQIQEDLSNQESKKENTLSAIGKMDKEIEKYKKRSIYFENLIVQTRLQIEQLEVDIDQYNQKKKYLRSELEEKQKSIEQKQNQIVSFLKSNQQMKKVKNVHQYELEEYEEQIVPIQNKIQDVEKQVMKMNLQIMSQFDSKIQQSEVIQDSKIRINKLKNKNKQITLKLLKSRNMIMRFAQSLTQLLDDPFDSQIRNRLGKLLNKYSINSSEFMPNQFLERLKKDNQRLMRKKNILRKAIEGEQKAQEGISRNKYQFFKFYGDNTGLVKEYNELTKQNKYLVNQKQKLQTKVKNLKNSIFKTPLKKSASLHIRKISEKKLTPFQRYEQQQYEGTSMKLKDTTQTKLTRGGSSTFLKSLIKDVGSTDNQLQKVDLIRDRIRTFVNPEMNRNNNIKKPLFFDGRNRGKSNLLKL